MLELVIVVHYSDSAATNSRIFSIGAEEHQP